MKSNGEVDETLSLEAHVENLREALSNLKATGEQGFEGLIGTALSSIMGIPFRLASSGYQRGVDGKSAFEGAVSFEGKLYTNALPRADVLSKIPDFVRHNDHADQVWVLGATSMVSTQLKDDLRADGIKEGISVLILDWVPSEFPRLAVALGMGGDKVKSFLTANLDAGEASEKAAAALDSIRLNSAFPQHEQKIREELDAPGMATVMAEKANVRWFEETLSSRARARSELGQPLAPEDTTVTVLSRDDLLRSFSPYLKDEPNGEVVCVHGEEGCGKSWFVIQSWLTQSDKPILVFAAADDFPEASAYDDIEELLIARLTHQTGEVSNRETTIRWRNRLNAWKDSGVPSRPRLILVIDGINQRPDRAWGRIIDNASTYLNEHGGRVIVTARTHYFNTRVKKALNSLSAEIAVPKWSKVERDKILKQHHIPVNSLNPSAAEFLRNPRILSIALEVFGDDTSAFEELNVDRLLFEHIMAAVKEDFGEHPIDFIAHLRTQARQLLDRASKQVRDDLRIFDSDVPAVADGRFYHAVIGEPQKYELRDEGLILALGFSIIENLRKAERNNRSLDDSLKEVLEPIEALDKAAEAVAAAITVCAADDEQYSREIASALVKGFAEFQNPPPDSLAALVSFAKARTIAFTDSARDLSLQGGHQPNFDWLQAALVEAAKSSTVWDLMAPEIQQWLRAHSLAPEHRMHRQSLRDPPEKVEEERLKRANELRERLEALSTTERKRLDRLIVTDGNIDVLSRLALVLLVGKKLEPFAQALTDWSFSNSLNGGFSVPDNDYRALIGLNRQDWTHARDTLLGSVEDLQDVAVSKTGRWALLRVLHATGHPDDGQVADTLYEELAEEHLARWAHLTANQEMIDPCDPDSSAPTDLGEIIERYQNLDVSVLRQGMGHTRDDHILVDDRPILSRFALETAVIKHRELTNHVIGRTGLPLRQGLIELRNNAALITEEQAQGLLAKWEQMQAAGDKQGLSDDDSILLEYELLAAFPFLDANRQMEILLATNENQPILLDLLDETGTVDTPTFDKFLNDIRISGTEHQQHLLLEIAADTGVILSHEASAFVATLVTSPVDKIRRSALCFAARSGETILLSAVADSEWASQAEENEKTQESWYGSYALLDAAAKGLAEGDAVLDRISPRLYGRAALLLKGPALLEIARRVEISIRHAAGLSDELIAPEIELEAEDSSSDEPVRFSVSEREHAPANIDDFFSRISESNEDFQARQNRNYDAFVAFKEELTTARAHIILDHLTRDEFASLTAADPAMAERLYELFIDLNDSKLPAVHNLLLLLAGAIADIDPEKSAALLERTDQSRPLVHFTFGKSGVDLGSLSVWAGGSAAALDGLRRSRLDMAETDQAIAVAVFSAQQCDNEDFLGSYIDEKLACDEPAEVARGIMVAGYCDQNPRIEAILKKYEGSAGLPGKAYLAAIAAYRNNGWARHWFQVMCEADCSIVFWQAGTLFTQCVDGRFVTWRDDFGQTGKPISSFGGSMNNRLKSRHEKLGKERAKFLFGQDAPSPIFVTKQGGDE